MMELQKAIIKYRDRSDYDRFYGDVGDTRYYIMKNGTLRNGNMIGSTELVEVIDPMIAAASLGVITPEGEVVIPFNNKTIKPINDKILLVEASKPISKSVTESLASRSDPLAATRLVNTAATIKDRMNNKLGAEGRFVFNDQFSEASLFTNEGQNVVNDQYYSYIGMNDDSIYLSSNIIDSRIVEYPLNAPFMKDDIFATAPQVEPEQQLDLNRVVIEKSDIDSAVAEVSGQPKGNEELLEEIDSIPKVADVVEESNNSNLISFPAIADEKKEMVLPTVQPTKIVENNVIDFSSQERNSLETGTESIMEEEDTAVSEQILENVEKTLMENDLDKKDTKLAGISSDSDLDITSSDYYGTGSVSIFEDATNAFSGLIEQTRQLKTDNAELTVMNTNLKEENEVLKTRLSTTKGKLGRCAEVISSLQAKVENQSAELEELRPQLQGKQDFIKLLDEAQMFLGKDTKIQENHAVGKRVA